MHWHVQASVESCRLLVSYCVSAATSRLGQEAPRGGGCGRSRPRHPSLAQWERPTTRALREGTRGALPIPQGAGQAPPQGVRDHEKLHLWQPQPEGQGPKASAEGCAGMLTAAALLARTYVVVRWEQLT